MTRSSVIPALLVLAVLCASGMGCAKARERWRARLNPPEPEPTRMIETGAGNLSAAEEGLEIIVWTANDPDHRVARTLREYAEGAPPVLPEDAARWAGMGIRLISVPAEDLESLLLACPPVSPLQRQRFGQVPQWTPLVRGPQLPEALPGPDGRPLPGGRPRLIARSWVEPRILDAQRVDVVRTELGIQIEHARRQTMLAEPDAERSIADEGHILHALLTTHTGAGTDALVMIAEHPAVAWDQLPEPVPSDPSTAAEDASGESDQDTLQPPPTPPSPPRPRTLGERMLSSPRIPAQDGRPPIEARKVIVVFLPRVRATSAPGTLPSTTLDSRPAEGPR